MRVFLMRASFACRPDKSQSVITCGLDRRVSRRCSMSFESASPFRASPVQNSAETYQKMRSARCLAACPDT
jgi:hypothetical protein